MRRRPGNLFGPQLVRLNRKVLVKFFPGPCPIESLVEPPSRAEYAAKFHRVLPLSSSFFLFFCPRYSLFLLLNKPSQPQGSESTSKTKAVCIPQQDELVVYSRRHPACPYFACLRPGLYSRAHAPRSSVGAQVGARTRSSNGKRSSERRRDRVRGLLLSISLKRMTV